MRSLYLLNRRFGPLSKLSEAEIRFSRREALRAALAAGAGLFSSACASRFQAPRADAARVVIIGGGFAGLVAAHELLALGYDVRVLEARERVGGRVTTFHDLVPGRPVEGGGELVGSNHPTWIAFAERFGLALRDMSSEEDLRVPLHLGGRLLADEEASRVWFELAASLPAVDARAAAVDSDQPWLSPEAGLLDALSIESGWLDALDASPATRDALAAQLAGDNGVANARASWLAMLAAVKGGGLERYWYESEAYRCSGGNQALAEALACALGERVATQSAVRAIDVERSPAVITCADGRELECDDVVLAAPPSTWSRIAIAPPLPAELRPQMGLATKYLTAVDRRFWLDAGRAQYALSDGPFTWTWESTDGQELGTGPAGLTAFSGGPSAESARAIPASERRAAFAAALETLQPGFGASVRSARWMDWPGDPWTLGGYSFPAPGEVTRLGPLYRQGLGRLHFSGEHASHAFVGYMEGALSSGVALARRLAARDGLAG